MYQSIPSEIIPLGNPWAFDPYQGPYSEEFD